MELNLKQHKNLEFCTFNSIEFCTFNSIFLYDKQLEIINDLKFGIELYKKQSNKTNNNITWDYLYYNIFNLCAYRKKTVHLKKIILNCIKFFLDDNNYDYSDGIVFKSWVNFHSSEKELLKLHSHVSQFHGYACVDPLDSLTIFKNPIVDEVLLQINNKPGLIYIGKSVNNSFHYVKMNSIMERPRITIAFDVDIVNNNTSRNLTIPTLADEVIFLS